MDKLRLGVIGLVHDHVWKILNDLQELKNVKITCASDVNTPLLVKAKEFGVKNTYKSYQQLLSEEKLDAVLIYTENSRHMSVTELAAEKDLHVMVEKPMAANLQQAERMLQASRKNGIKLMINYPTAWYPSFREAYKQANQQSIGRIYQVRYRAAHEGPKEIGCSPYFYEWLYNRELNGAGVFMDYCCYGVNLCRWLLGVPEKTFALGGTYVRDYLRVEDNAILLMDYSKAMGIAEASWSQIGEGIPPRYTLIINASEGVIAAGKELRIYTAKKKQWNIIESSPLQKGEQTAVEHFITCILEDKPLMDLVSPTFNFEVQGILEAGLISMREHRAISLNEVVFK